MILRKNTHESAAERETHLVRDAELFQVGDVVVELATSSSLFFFLLFLFLLLLLFFDVLLGRLQTENYGVMESSSAFSVSRRGAQKGRGAAQKNSAGGLASHSI